MSIVVNQYLNKIDPGLPWLASVPAHWNVKRAKQVFRCIDVRSKAGNEELLTVSSADGVRKRNSKAVTMFMAESYTGHKLCWPGDLVVNSLWAWATGLGFSRYHGIVSTAYSIYRPIRKYAANWEYFHHLFRSRAYDWELTIRSKGIWISRLQMTDDSFMQMPVLLPPADEQAAIVRFINHIDHRVNRLIKAKCRLIELLNEQKQSIIHIAVTRGLDPDAPMMQSRLELLAQIPKHWTTRRLRMLVVRIEQGASPQAAGFTAVGDSWGVLKSGCVNGGVFRQTEHKQLPQDYQIDHGIVVKTGDVLISRACGSPRFVGSVGKVRSLNYKLILSDKTFRAVFKPDIDTDFMVYAMNCRYYRQQVERAISGAEGMANNLPLSSLKDFVFALPPADEAVAIRKRLDRDLNHIEQPLSKYMREIELLREYRTRLIADVVTGQVDVRRLALPEIDEAPGVVEIGADELDGEDGDGATSDEGEMDD